MTTKHWICSLVSVAVIAGNAFQTDDAHGQDREKKVSMNDPLLKPWDGPYGGVPPWRSINIEKFLAAFDVAIEMSTRDIRKIADNSEPANFENTIVALEHAGKALERIDNIFGVYSSNLNVGTIPDIERAVAPKLSKHNDSIMQNEKLFKRIETVYEGEEMKMLTSAQKRLVKDRYENFVRQGAKLNKEQKARLSQINVQLAGLFTQFSQNVLADEGETIVITDKSELDGLPESIVAAMAEAGRELSKEGDDKPKWVITNTRSSMEPYLTYATNRKMREKVWRTYYDRGDNGDDRD